MRFVHPDWLWGLIALPLFYFLVLWVRRRRRRNFDRFATRKVQPLIAPELDWWAGVKKARLWVLAMGFVFIALARPQFGTDEETIKVSGMDIIVALDISNSMMVEDVVPSRLKKAKHLVRNLLGRLGGDRVGLVAFAASAFLASPLTTDLNYLIGIIKNLNPSMIANQGTDIGLALEVAAKALDRGSEGETQPDQGATQTPPSRAVVLISDGEDFEEQISKGADFIKQTGARLFVIGVGTKKGKPIPIRDERGNLVGYRKDASGKVAISSFHPEALQVLATRAKGRYWSVSANEVEVDEILADLGILDRTDYTEKKILIFKDRYQIPLLLAVLLLFLELCLPARRVILGTGATVWGFFLFLPLAQAEPSMEVYLNNKKGIEAYEAKDLPKAREHFGKAQAKDPFSAKLRFNQGVIEVEEGNAEAAVKTFDQAAQAAEKQQQPGLEGRARYNQGATYQKSGDLGAAIQSYLAGIEAAKKGKDAYLETNLRRKLELLSQQQQQKQQQKDKKEKRDQRQKGEQDQKDQQANKDDKGQGQEKDQEQQKPQYKQTEKQKNFDSKKLSKDDANRVMNELANRERQLKQKLNKKQRKVRKNAKDW